MSSKEPLILASTSPRRRQLLQEAGISFEPVPPGVDEALFDPEGLEPVFYAKMLATAKAESIASSFPYRLVAGADTIVDFKGKIIGKPADAEEAEKFTRELFSGPHEVITAVALIRRSRGILMVSSETTRVFPRKLSEAQIAEHIRGGAWRGKAGAYAIQENGDEFIEKIEGSFTNVIGMPMELFAKMMKEISDAGGGD